MGLMFTLVLYARRTALKMHTEMSKQCLLCFALCSLWIEEFVFVSHLKLNFIV